MSDDTRKVLLRLPDHIYSAVGNAAHRENRSMNAEIIWAIRCYLAARSLHPAGSAETERQHSASDPIAK